MAALPLAGCDRVLQLEPVTATHASPRALVFDNAASTTDLQEFPVLVSVDKSIADVASVVDPSHDFRFHDPVGDVDLPFEVEHWDPSGQSEIWVRVPIIHARSTTDSILMYFGPSAHGAADPTGVWKSSYDLVYHGDLPVDAASANDVVTAFADPNSGQLPDTTAPGAIGNGARFAGLTYQHFEFSTSTALLDGWNAFTIEVWVRPEYPSLALNNDEDFVLGKSLAMSSAGVTSGRLFNASKVNGAPLVFQTDFHFTNSADANPNFFLPNATWSHIVFTFDGTVLLSHRDGVATDAEAYPTPTSLVPGSGRLLLGSNDGGSKAILGTLDELRVAHRAMTEDWVYAQYLAMTDHLITFRDP